MMVRRRMTKRSAMSIALMMIVYAGSAMMTTTLAHGGDEDPCQPEWVPTFGGHPSIPSSPSCMLTWDDGTGEAVYIAGSVTGNAQFVLRWDGQTMTTIAHTIDGPVKAMTIFDDGAGEALYVGGDFTFFAGIEAHNIAKWDGKTWSAVGAGLDGGAVRALTVFDDGNGLALYVGGAFTSSSGADVNRVVRWDGTAFTSVGAGLNNTVYALAEFDDGSGPSLYAGGSFAGIMPDNTRGIAQWDGAQWTSVGLGISQCNPGGGPPCTPSVFSLISHDDGTGLALYVGGRFINAGDAIANGFARWDGLGWTAPGAGMSVQSPHFTVYTFHTRMENGQPMLYIGGDFLFHLGQPDECWNILRWDGAAFLNVNGGLGYSVRGLTSFDDGSGGGSELYIGAEFSLVRKLTNGFFQPLGPGMNDDILDLAVFDDGTGSALYVAGDFEAIDGEVFNRIAKWTGTGWETLGDGLNDRVYALEVFDDGNGPALYAGGAFTHAGALEVNRIAKWNGAAWSALGDGIGAPSSEEEVFALKSFDDGTGTALYVGGDFLIAGGVAASRVARWNGAQWSAVGQSSGADVHAFGVHDDGSGVHLYAGGSYSSSDGTVQGDVGMWTGKTWEPIGSNLTYWVLAIESYADGWGTDPELYIGTREASSNAPGVRRLENNVWVPVGSGANGTVTTLTTFADGASNLPALFAAGDPIDFPIGSQLRRWNGLSWQSEMFSGIRTSIVFDDGTGPSLFVAGGFGTSPAGDAYIAQLRGCPTDGLLADVNNDGAVNANDQAFFCVLAGMSYGDPFYYLGADLNRDGVIDHLDLAMLDEYLPRCPGDAVRSLTNAPPPDGVVDGADLAYLLGQWGPAATCADFVTSATFAPPPDGIVNGADLAVLLGAWGPCK